MWNHIAGQKRLPGMYIDAIPLQLVVTAFRVLAVQWSSWLTYTRAHPPTLEVRLHWSSLRIGKKKWN